MVRVRLEADILAMRAAVLSHPLPNPSGADVMAILEVYRHEREWASAMHEQVRQVEEALDEECGRARRQTFGRAARVRRTILPSPRPASG